MYSLLFEKYSHPRFRSTTFTFSETWMQSTLTLSAFAILSNYIFMSMESTFCVNSFGAGQFGVYFAKLVLEFGKTFFYVFLFSLSLAKQKRGFYICL